MGTSDVSHALRLAQGPWATVAQRQTRAPWAWTCEVETRIQGRPWRGLGPDVIGFCRLLLDETDWNCNGKGEKPLTLI